MDTQKQQVADRLKQANNILVTVSSNPSVDQLAACIGLTLALNKLGKHATAVFSGTVPSTIEFLQPEKTLEKNTDSLRDFIIALDKSKADKLRYKVEDKVVKIFITPYKTSISDKDLDFSQGDFNVDVVVALGVHNQADLDQAITAHGRILHDAVVTTLNVKPGGELGAINWLDPKASSLSELVLQLIDAIDKSVVDGQLATALLTGIVAETERFGNDKTSAQTMSMSAELMAAGANQQLVATKLEEARPKPPIPTEIPKETPETVAAPKPAGLMAQAVTAKKEEGTLEIEHSKPKFDFSPASDPEEEKQALTPQIDIDREGTLRRLEEVKEAEKKSEEPGANSAEHIAGPHMILQPPSMGGQLTANVFPENMSSDPLSLPQPDGPMLERPSGAPPVDTANTFPPLPPLNDDSQAPPASDPANPVGDTDRTLSQIEQAVDSPHAGQSVDPNHLSNARDAVNQAIVGQPPARPLGPIAALNAQPMDLNLRDTPSTSDAPAHQDDSVSPSDPNAPPPVPPPMMPPPQ